MFGDIQFSKDIIRSNNLQHIGPYCATHNIDYLTTMDFLCEAEVAFTYGRKGESDYPK